MKLQGSFVNQKGQTVAVLLDDLGSDSTVVAIEPGGDVQFAADDTVVIESGVNDSFDVVQQHSATIKLQAKRFMKELFASGVHSIGVDISVDGKVLFDGWVEPNVYSQSFIDPYDDLEISCIDGLSALQYTNWAFVDSNKPWKDAVRAATMTTFQDIIEGCLNEGGFDVNHTIFYDGSKQLINGKAKDIFSQLSVSELAFLGDSEDGVKTFRDVLEGVLKYLNLHIVQYGLSYYIYSWETLRKGGFTWIKIEGTGESVYTPTSSVTTISLQNVEDADAQINIGEVYNKLSLKVSPKTYDDLIDSPLDGSNKYPAYPCRQKYVSEYYADGNGTRATNGFTDLLQTGTTTYDAGYSYDFLLRVKKSTAWTFGHAGNDYVKTYGSDKKNQQEIPNQLRKEIGCALLSFGKIDAKANGQDDTPAKNPEMTDYLVVSVNGNEVDTEAGAKPNSDDVKAAIPVAEYVGGESGGVYSPADTGMTNYIVISGSMILNPIMHTSGNYNSLPTIGDVDTPIGQLKANGQYTPVTSRTNGDGRFLTFRWYKSETGKNPTADDNPIVESDGYSNGFIPYTEDGPELYKYNYSEIGSSTDKTKKLGILECMLVVGNKVLVEDKTGDGSPSCFAWKKYKKESECTEEEYYNQTFTIGINPKIGDKIIGDEYEIPRNFAYTDNIGADNGMAIPIPYDAHLYGKVTFRILGPVLWTWNDITRRHPTMFRHTKWSSTEIPLMAHVSSIIIKSLEIKICSDVSDDGDDSDIIYTSDTYENYYNKKDDLEFLIHSGFTSVECREHSLKSSACIATVIDNRDNSPLLTVMDNNAGVAAKPEKEYVDAYWQECHLPRVVLTQNLQNTGSIVNPFALYKHEGLNKTFYVRDMGFNLMEGSAQMNFEEVFTSGE